MVEAAGTASPLYPIPVASITEVPWYVGLATVKIAGTDATVTFSVQDFPPMLNAKDAVPDDAGVPVMV